MPVFAKGGTFSVATTSSASTRPRASRVAKRRGASTATGSRIVDCASASEITPLRVSHRPAVGDVRAQPFAERRTEIAAVERELDVRAQEVELRPDVVATAPAVAAEHTLIFEQHRDRVG